LSDNFTQDTQIQSGLCTYVGFTTTEKDPNGQYSSSFLGRVHFVLFVRLVPIPKVRFILSLNSVNILRAVFASKPSLGTHIKLLGSLQCLFKKSIYSGIPIMGSLESNLFPSCWLAISSGQFFR